MLWNQMLFVEICEVAFAYDVLVAGVTHSAAGNGSSDFS
ncbi:hypothetical protein CFter6_5258 [Collimonas fungivorans]|uniref:Uncharacterized protein n=2 Tax=Collimonas fungivorans TaxID=158899 RepID=G0AFR5_COLFT|nr:hypothetical protein CFU_4333 [Collimonas fungivorans Ter331]AMO97825.1 hypothetical protein CFter6_5258 [Collimonas fungivorans]